MPYAVESGDAAELTAHNGMLASRVFANVDLLSEQVRVPSYVTRHPRRRPSFEASGAAGNAPNSPGPPPAWFDAVVQGFREVQLLEENWDSYGAKKIDLSTINVAIRWLERLLCVCSPTPSIVPLASGGIQIEWHRKGHDLEIVFNPGRAPEFFHRNEVATIEEEGSVQNQYNRLEAIICELEP